MTAEVEEALAGVFKVMAERPEKNMFVVYEDLMAGRRPSVCPLSLGRVQKPDEVPAEAPKDHADFDRPEKRLLDGLRGIPNALKLENFYSPALGVCFGTSTVATAFGIEMDLGNPHNPGGVKSYLPLETFDDFAPPDINSAGLFPRIKELIDYYRANTPPEIKIGYPDLQGPINIAHIILGTELFVAMHEESERVHHLLQMITDFLIQCCLNLSAWIGEDRLIPFIIATKRIAECSVNLISRQTYREFGLPYDRQIADFHGEIGIHTCNGKHVFEETLRGLPNVRYTEWGVVAPAFAPCTPLEDALQEVGDRQVILSGGQELWEGDYEQIIKDHFARLGDHSLLSFGYCGMYWTGADEPEITAMHRRLDEYYMTHFVN